MAQGWFGDGARKGTPELLSKQWLLYGDMGMGVNSLTPPRCRSRPWIDHERLQKKGPPLRGPDQALKTFLVICLVYIGNPNDSDFVGLYEHMFIDIINLWRMIGSVQVFLNKIDSLSMKVSWTLKDIGLIWSLYVVKNCLGFFGPWCENQPPQIAMSTWGLYTLYIFTWFVYFGLIPLFLVISPHLHHLLAASSQLLGLVGLTVEGFLGYLVGYIKNTVFLDKLNVFTKR